MSWRWRESSGEERKGVLVMDEDGVVGLHCDRFIVSEVWKDYRYWVKWCPS